MGQLSAAMGEAAAAAAEAFERHWRAEFPGEAPPPPPPLRLASVPALEAELGRCRRRLQQLERRLAEERFRVGYLEAALAARRPGETDTETERGATAAATTTTADGAPGIAVPAGARPRGKFRLLPRRAGEPPLGRPSPPPRRCRRNWQQQQDLPDEGRTSPPRRPLGPHDPPRGGGGGGDSSDWSGNSSDREDASSAGRTPGPQGAPDLSTWHTTQG